MTITYRTQISTPMTWAQLDENFRTVENISKDVYDQYKATEGYAKQTQEGIQKAVQAAADSKASADASAAAVGTAQQAATTASQSANSAATQAQAASQSAALVQSYALAAVFKSTSGVAGATISLNVTGATVVRATLVQDVTNFTLTGNIPDGEARTFTIILDQGVGSRKVTWDPRIKWSGNRQPVLSFDPSSKDIITIMVVGGSATFFGFFNGGSFD